MKSRLLIFILLAGCVTKPNPVYREPLDGLFTASFVAGFNQYATGKSALIEMQPYILDAERDGWTHREIMPVVNQAITNATIDAKRDEKFERERK